MSLFSSMAKLVGVGGPALNYTLSDTPYNQAWGCWTHYPATSRDDGSPASVFKLTVMDPNDVKLIAARNGVKRLKMLRHPNVLAYKDSLEVHEKGGVTLYLVTEPVKPLALVLSELELSGQHKDEYLATGILHMANAVAFINNDVKMIHGHLCMAAVVVTETLDWKLHGFDLLSEAAAQGDLPLRHSSWMVPQQYKAAEVARQEWGVVAEGPSWAVDAWGLGCMIQEVFSGEPLRSVDQLRNTSVIPPALLADYQKLLSSAPDRRLNPARVAESKFLNNTLVRVVAFMESIAVKDAAEKDAFFKRLPSLLPAIPSPVAVQKLLPLLSKALEFGGAPACAVGPLLQIGRPLPPEDFLRRVVPSLAKLFASPDRNLRRSLLEAVDSWGPHLTTSVLEDQIFPNLQTGYSDDNAYIRELTLKATLTLAPKMKQATLTGTVLRHLNRLQMDQEPSIRANTTVLLGNMADLMGEAYCRKVLLNAFGRALKDPFPPARVAALRALVATLKHHAPEEVACRAAPVVAPLCVDQIPEVRGAALAAIEAFAKRLREHDEKLTKDAAAAAAAAGPGAPAGSPAQAATAALSSGAAGMLGWAMSSLVGGAPSSPRVAPRGGPMAPPAAGFGGPAPAAAAAAAAAPSSPMAPAAAAARGGLGGVGSSGGGAASSAANDWDVDDEAFEDAEEAAARNRLRSLGMGGGGGGAAASSSGRPGAGGSGGLGAARTAGGHLLPPGQRPRGSSGSGGVASGGGAAASGGSFGSRAPAAAAAAAAPAASGAGKAAANGWGDDDDDGWEDMAPTPTASVSSPKPATPSSPAARPRPLGARPAAGAAAGGGGLAGAAAAPKPKGAMKLGASKLGAQKLVLD